MSSEDSRCSLLAELDARQTEVLDELEQLNQRIERLISEVTAWRAADCPAPALAAA